MLCVWYICWFSIFTLVNVKRSRDITTVGHLRLVFILFNFLVTVSPNLCLNFTIFFSKQTTYFFLSSNKKFPQSRITIFFFLQFLQYLSSCILDQIIYILSSGKFTALLPISQDLSLGCSWAFSNNFLSILF